MPISSRKLLISLLIFPSHFCIISAKKLELLIFETADFERNLLLGVENEKEH